MSRTLLCSTGTSIAQGCNALGKLQRRSTCWDEQLPELVGEIRERLKDFDFSNDSDRVGASAELNILQRLGITPADDVILFATDTAEGRACCEAVAETIRKHFGNNRVIIERVEGLQVRDADRLRRTGLVNLSRRLVHYLDDPQRRYGGGCIICPNGGFKGVVPFMTVLGMMYRTPVVYVFEFANALIQLPPLPIGFATDLFERALPALHWAADTGVFDPADFFRRIPGCSEDQQPWFDSFLETVEGDQGRPMASLSPLTEMLVDREGNSPENILLLSIVATDELNTLKGKACMEVLDHFRKLTSPLWRSQHLDMKFNSDLEFFPRGHNPWRFAGFVKEGLFHLCWFTTHDQYERRIPMVNMQRAAFETKIFNRFVVPNKEAKTTDLFDDDPDLAKDWSILREERDAAYTELADAKKYILNLREMVERSDQVNLKLLAQLADASARPTNLKQNKSSRSSDASKSHHSKWIHKIVECRFMGTKGKSYHFQIEGDVEQSAVLVPRQKIPHPPPVDSTINLRINGFDGIYFQAEPI